MAVEWIKDDDTKYLEWCKRHPDGYVANTRRTVSSSYLVLHKASCPSILNYLHMEKKPGGFTERGYTKVCAEKESELRLDLRRRTSESEPFSGICRCVGPRS